MSITAVIPVRESEEGPLVLWIMADHTDTEIGDMKEALDRARPKDPFTLLALKTDDWNRDLSPWRGKAAFGNEDFSGGGPETLKYLTEDLLPSIREKYGSRKIFLCGYSLAGLFALWAACESPDFDGILCASGSLWFEGWSNYAADHRVKSRGPVLLSLGSKEEKTKNPLMSQVGDRTRAQFRLLKEDPAVTECRLDWFPGGHFNKTKERLADGIARLLRADAKRI